MRDQSKKSLWLISGANDSELILTRQATAGRDYSSRVDDEAELLRSQQITVSGPVTTRLFGQPAAALSSSGPEYSRIIIASEDWSVRAHRQGPFDAAWARTVSGMLSRGGQGPEVPSLE